MINRLSQFDPPDNSVIARIGPPDDDDGRAVVHCLTPCGQWTATIDPIRRNDKAAAGFFPMAAFGQLGLVRVELHSHQDCRAYFADVAIGHSVESILIQSYPSLLKFLGSMVPMFSLQGV